MDALKSEYSNLIKNNKEKHLQSRESSVRSKKYWTAMRKILKKKITSVIPPILFNGLFILSSGEKGSIFNEYFKDQCTTIVTSSTLPPLTKSTNLSLKKITFNKQSILNHIEKLNVSKAHGHDSISIRMIKMGGRSIARPLFIIFKNCIAKGHFPKKWKMANVIPVYKKKERNLITNYRPVSLLPIFGKLFEKVIFDSLYPYIFNNKFISDKQSGYRRGDSTVKQLLSISHEIYKAFGKSQEIRAFS